MPNQNAKDVLAAVTDGRGPDAVLEVVGVPDAIKTALDLVRPWGAISSCGVHYDEIALPGNLLYGKVRIWLAALRGFSRLKIMHRMFGSNSGAVRSAHSSQRPSSCSSSTRNSSNLSSRTMCRSSAGQSTTSSLRSARSSRLCSVSRN